MQFILCTQRKEIQFLCLFSWASIVSRKVEQLCLTAKSFESHWLTSRAPTLPGGPFTGSEKLLLILPTQKEKKTKASEEIQECDMTSKPVVLSCTCLKMKERSISLFTQPVILAVHRLKGRVCDSGERLFVFELNRQSNLTPSLCSWSNVLFVARAELVLVPLSSLKCSLLVKVSCQ